MQSCLTTHTFSECVCVSFSLQSEAGIYLNIISRINSTYPVCHEALQMFSCSILAPPCHNDTHPKLPCKSCEYQNTGQTITFSAEQRVYRIIMLYIQLTANSIAFMSLKYHLNCIKQYEDTIIIKKCYHSLPLFWQLKFSIRSLGVVCPGSI